MVTIVEYAWMYNESVGVTVAGRWSAERGSGRKQVEAALCQVQEAQNWLGTADYARLSGFLLKKRPSAQ